MCVLQASVPMRCVVQLVVRSSSHEVMLALQQQPEAWVEDISQVRHLQAVTQQQLVITSVETPNAHVPVPLTSWRTKRMRCNLPSRLAPALAVILDCL
jgi:hypothetical protein